MILLCVCVWGGVFHHNKHTKGYSNELKRTTVVVADYVGARFDQLLLGKSWCTERRTSREHALRGRAAIHKRVTPKYHNAQ